MTGLSPEARRALQWMADFESSYAGWKIDGRDPRKGDKPASWNQMELRGPQGSIVIPVDVWRSLKGLIVGGGKEHRRIYMPSPEGEAALASKDGAA